MYQASAPVFIRQLGAISKVLDNGEAFAREKGINPAELIDARLASDMYPLPAQIQIGTDVAKGTIARLAGLEIPSYPDTETSFADLQERIAKTITFIESVSAEQVDGSEQREIVLKIGEQNMSFQGQAYLLHFALPNFFFHMTTAYGILRHKGVAIGKRAFLGGI